MATDPRPVRCKKCGYEWESRADDPRCPDPNDECGRARAEEIESTSGSDSQDDEESGTDSTDTSEDTDSGSSGLFFEVSQERTGGGSDAPDVSTSPPTSDDDEDEDEEDEEIEAPDLEPEDIRPMFVFAFGDRDEDVPGFLSNRRGEHWRLREHELDQLSQAWVRVGNKYLPYLLAEYKVEGMAVLSTFMIMAPRLQEDRRRAELKAKEEHDTEPGGAESRTSSSEDQSVDELIDEEEDEVEETDDELDLAINRA